MPAETGEGVAQSVMSLGRVVLRKERFFIASGRFGGPAKIHERVAAIIPGAPIGGVELESGVVTGDRAFGVAKIAEAVAKSDMRGGFAGGEGNGLTQQGHAMFRPPRLQRRRAEEMEGIEMVWAIAQDGFVQTRGLLKLSLPV